MVLIESPLSNGAIGARYDGSASGKTINSYYTGFMYSINVNTGARTVSEFSDFITNDCTGTCTFCPPQNECDLCPGTCLWNCEWNEYEDSNGTCQTCSDCGEPHVNNWSGCVDGTNCTVCHNPDCNNCEDFDTDTCLPCSNRCSDCFGSVTRESLYDCISCSSGYIMHNSICTLNCPSGFQANGGNCVALTTNDSQISVAHWMFNQFTSVYIDTISAKKARLGSTSNWYPSYDSSDPKLVRWGGLSFSGSDIVYVTPYDAEVDSIVFNYDFTVEVVFKPTAVTSNKQYMLYKGNSAKNRVAFAFGSSGADLFVDVYFQSVLKNGNPVVVEKNLGTFPTSNTWSHLAIVLSHTGSQASAATTISSYVNGEKLIQQTTADVFFEDDATNTFLLGGSWQDGTL